MSALIAAAFRAARSIFAPGMLAVFVWSIVFTIMALIGFVIVSGMVSNILAAHVADAGWAWLVRWGGTVSAGLIAWFLFPGIMPIIVSFFDNRIADLIERQNYPQSLILHKPKFWPELLHDIRFSFVALLLNILALPLYVLPGLNLFVFYGLNGYLLGREFFLMSARRHMPVEDAEKLRKQHGRLTFIAGIGITIMATVPLANLLAPFWGIALMVHLYHFLTKNAA